MRAGGSGLQIVPAEPGTARLPVDYRRAEDRLAPFFLGHPRDPAAYIRRAVELDRRFDRARRRRIAAAARPSSPAAERRLRDVAEGDGLMVSTGQQAGLFTGPLYTIYKALTAVRLARELEQRLGRTVVPLFWVASDDHDWAEVNHVHVLDRDNRLRRIGLEDSTGGEAIPMSRHLLGPRVERAIAELESLLPRTEYSRESFHLLRRAYTSDRSVAGAFSEVMIELMAPFDMAIADSADPLIREQAAPVLLAELDNHSSHQEALERQSRRLAAAGYEVQIPILPSATNLFYDGPAGRERVLIDGRDFVLRGSGTPLTGSELRQAIVETRLVTPNVALRPVVESAIFPTLAYVAGPSELAYFAQLGCLFDAVGIGMPIAFPRAGMLLVEGKVAKVLDKFGLEPAAFERPAHEVASRVLRRELPPELAAALREARAAIEAAYGPLEGAVTGVDPTLAASVGRARTISLSELDQLEGKVANSVEMAGLVGIEQIAKAASNLFPGGAPQERVLNLFQYLVRYGPGLLSDLLERIEVELDASADAWSGPPCDRAG